MYIWGHVCTRHSFMSTVFHTKNVTSYSLFKLYHMHRKECKDQFLELKNGDIKILH